MKINPKINKEVNAAIVECRRVLTDATIKLMKQVGAQEGDDVVFDSVLILYQRENGTMRTILCDRVSYCDHGGNPFYLTYLEYGEDKHVSSSFMISIENMKIIYEEVRKIVRRH